jgi:hypothetical protein
MACSKSGLLTEPEFGRFVHYKLMTLIPVSAALIAITRHAETIGWAVAYVGLCLLHAGIMFTIKCPHCPYYKIEGRTYRCFMFWKAPKLYAPRAGQERRFVGIYAPIGMLILTFFPVYWLRFEWELLALYLLSIGVLLSAIGLEQCPRCMNFDCGHNRVPEDVRNAIAREGVP